MFQTVLTETVILSFGHLNFENLILFRISIFEFRIYPSILEMEQGFTFGPAATRPKEEISFGYWHHGGHFQPGSSGALAGS